MSSLAHEHDPNTTSFELQKFQSLRRLPAVQAIRQPLELSFFRLSLVVRFKGVILRFLNGGVHFARFYDSRRTYPPKNAN